MSPAQQDAGVAGFARFVATAGVDIRLVRAGAEAMGRGTAPDDALVRAAFRVGLTSLLVGAEDVGRVALAVERALDMLRAGSLEPERCASLLEGPTLALVAAIEQLEHPDKSGARVEGIDLTGISKALDAALDDASAAVPRAPELPARRPDPPPPIATPARAAGGASPAAQAFAWTPTVDDDMVELFFEEARERIEGISGKLLDLERRSGDTELLRDLFRDLHTVKGSSAMVGLEPVNRLAHAAEDLVGQLRDGERSADVGVINALLATLDGLREMLDRARSRSPITTDPAPLVRALRDPAATLPIAAAPLLAVAGALPAAQPKADHGGPARATIRVDFDKLDRLMNLVGELVLGREGLRGAHSALTAIAAELTADRTIARRSAHDRPNARVARVETPGKALEELLAELSRVERVLQVIATDLDGSTGRLQTVSSELRDQVMRLRMVPVGGVLRKHQRTVRDLGQSLGKRVHLELVGEETQLDKLLVDALDEPLLHLLRNAVDHGVEGPDERTRAGKPPEGTVRIEARHQGNQVVIVIADDGHGISPDKLKQRARDKGLASPAEIDAMDERAALEIIFLPGFSTAATVSDVSGRGVGMDIVRQTIVSRLKGTIDIDSMLGAGTTFTLRLPLTLAIIQVILARAAGEVFAIPVDSALRTLVVPPGDVRLVGDREVIDVNGEVVPLIRLDAVLELDGGSPSGEDPLYVVLTEQGDDLFGLACEFLLGKKEIVIKSLGELLAHVPCTAGATLLGDRCALILDVPAVVQRALKQPRRASRRDPTASASKPPLASVLLVEDSDTVRESLRRLLVEAGYDVTTAEDGQLGLEAAMKKQFDVVSTDVMMPRMDGYELTRALRATAAYKATPIVMVTSRGEMIDRVRGFDAGVDDYITKPHDRQLLLRSIQKLLGHAAK